MFFIYDLRPMYQNFQQNFHPKPISPEICELASAAVGPLEADACGDLKG